MTPSVAAAEVRSAPDADWESPEDSSSGVRVVRQRDGRAEEAPLFMVPGLDGEPGELTPLTSAFAGSQTVYALSPMLRDAAEQPVASIERIAELIVMAIREIQPTGPYRLGGYSFGALVAVETAHQLRASGENVEALFLIEAVYDERFWPRSTWLLALGRRTIRHLRRIARTDRSVAIGELRQRSARLVERVARRYVDAGDQRRAEAQDELTIRRRAEYALSRYRPRFYDGRVTLITSSRDRYFGCDTVRLWSGLAKHVDIQRIDADHVTIMREPASLAVAQAIDRRLAILNGVGGALRPIRGFTRPMILTTMRWFSTARLAHALTEAGFSVSTCAPRSHALDLVDGLTYQGRFNRLRPIRSISNAIRGARPDIVVPDDERALTLLRRLYHEAQADDPEMAALISRSLGKEEDWRSLSSRSGLNDEVLSWGVPGVSTPVTRVIEDAGMLDEWIAGEGLPTVLKTDGSWGGRGVAIVRETSDLRSVWWTISNPPGLTRTLKRTLLDGDTASAAMWARRTRPAVNAQQFVSGREAIATVACVDGAVSALMCFEVVKATAARGPAAIVRLIEHAGMAETARQLVKRYGLSGFYGLDFMISDDGPAQLLEVNLRATPTCHLLVEGGYVPGQIVRLFPVDLIHSDPGTDTRGLLDLPLHAPSLIRAGERMAARANRPVSRLTRRLTKKFSPMPD